MPSADDMEKVYPVEDWSRDMDFWFSKGTLSPAEFPQVAAYYRKVQAANPKREENCSRMWMALAFLQSFLPDLVRGGAALQDSSGATTLPSSLVTALYRTFMSPVASIRPQSIDVPLVLEAVKDQKDFNEDRS
jgi:hypothetical protein